ncbi:nuclear transport factor 2 family protein [Streptomyces sp. SP18CS02]|uniref:nuclear transport factor 2 family protein n=1 Tax=Streptomyces sp. SP18CS02 TaxID=3002531 RepID=UPI002E767CC7|nr:nuclear transport factor 2 family protein [Streptomyces sp. SP18CS02]MEE1752322.1 nuclear transport factor 2 family protein [Streptomyces sp. SP18CS02]
MTVHPHITVFQRAMSAFSAGDMKALAKVFAPGVVWHLTGRGPLSGVYEGRDATFGLFARVFELSGGTFASRLRDVLANDDHTVALLHGTASREGRHLDMDFAIVFHIDEGKVTEGWETWTDQAAFGEFWS